MRSGCLVVAACLAACGGDEGIRIEVQGTPETTHVEVFIASEAACTECALQPKQVDEMLIGSRYTRDPDPVLVVTADSAHVAGFGIQPNAEVDKVRSIVVIGYDAAMNISGAALIKDLHTTEPHLYRATLTPVTAEPLAKTAPTSGSQSGSQRAQVWWGRNGAEHGKCVGLEQWSGPTLTDRTFIVPADDPDCDDVLEAAECNSYAYISSTLIASDTINCVTDDKFVNGMQPCQFGVQTCTDGMPKGMCDPNQHACVPQSICNDPAPCPAGQERECLVEKIRSSTLTSVVKCTIPFEQDPNGGLRTCGGERATAQIYGLEAAFKNPNVWATDVGVIGAGGGFMFAHMLQLGSSSLIEVATATAAAGVITVKWTGGYELASSNEPITLGMKITTNGAHSLLLPLQIHPTTCAMTLSASCNLLLDADFDMFDDPIAACAQ